MLYKTLIALAAAIAIGSVPVATNALAADHPGGHAGGGHAMGGHAMGGRRERADMRGAGLPADMVDMPVPAMLRATGVVTSGVAMSEMVTPADRSTIAAVATMAPVTAARATTFPLSAA